ncbi:hypothetical protein AB833_17095 [Chromatiales bacterium (ex Bugula neritina AB1)]|nr:hypothetical protein AB833_17095 [Chromatiales bacterium (ex Bugula neritina AB1)]
MLSIHLSDMPVTRKLRVVFGSIIALILIAFTIGGYQLNKLIHAKEHTIARSVPALVNSQHLAALLSNFSEVAERLNTEESHEASLAIGNKLAQISTDVFSTMKTMEEQFIGLTELEQELEALERVRSELVDLKTELLAIEQISKTDIDEIKKLRQSFSTLIEPYLLRAATGYKNSLQTVLRSTESNNFNQDQRQSLNNHGKTQAQLTEISFRLSNLIDKVTELPSIHDEDYNKLNELNREVEFESLGITQLLVDLNDAEMRKNLAQLITKFRTLSLGENGVVANERSRIEYHTKFQASQLEKYRILGKITEIIKNNTTSMEQNTFRSAEIFDRTLKNTVIVLLIVGVIILSLILLVLHFVVELQLSKRMADLTSAVNDIASGNLNRSVGISGRDEIGQMALALGVFKANAKELRRSNKDLEQFAYAASHDLKSPLASIKVLAEWIKEDTEDMSADFIENVDLLLSRVNRLSSLQADLLEYAKAGLSDDELKLLNVEKMVASLSDLLDPEQRFRINVVQLETPLVKTQIAPLRQVLLNLINNAIKHHNQTHGTIDIEVNYKNSRIYFSVADDGPGIDPQYHDEIFGMFQTLQSKDVVEGSGLGLSLVRKIVDRFGGTIKVVSDGKTGTMFIFDWPLIWQSEYEKIAA